MIYSCKNMFEFNNKDTKKHKLYLFKLNNILLALFVSK